MNELLACMLLVFNVRVVMDGWVQVGGISEFGGGGFLVRDGL
jgi:hypothetical protein